VDIEVKPLEERGLNMFLVPQLLVKIENSLTLKL